MKKTLISSLILATFILPVSPIHAQTFTVEQQTSLESLKQQIIDLLLAQITLLQEQLVALQAEQASTAAVVANLSVEEEEQSNEDEGVELGAEENTTPERALLAIYGSHNAFQITMLDFTKSQQGVEVVSMPESLRLKAVESGAVGCDQNACFYTRHIERSDIPSPRPSGNSFELPDDNTVYTITIKAFGEEYTANLKKGESKTFVDTR